MNCLVIDVMGQSINYEVHGSGKDIVLLHGWGCSISSFVPFIKSFSDKFRITAIDFPGFGNSAPL